MTVSLIARPIHDAAESTIKGALGGALLPNIDVWLAAAGQLRNGTNSVNPFSAKLAGPPRQVTGKSSLLCCPSATIMLGTRLPTLGKQINQIVLHE